MEKFFNTAGPIQCDIHYYIDPLKRFDLDEVLMLIAQRKYFVIHAPRQTGKTTCLLALRDLLNSRNDYMSLYVNVESGQAARNNVASVVKGICESITDEMSILFHDETAFQVKEEVQSMEPSVMLTSFLFRLSSKLPKPLVLLIDEIDSLVGDSLVSVLRQIRTGYTKRPVNFPQSIILCGVRDVCDYRIVLSNQDIVSGGSAFNIKSESLRLGNLNEEEIRQLYLQHTQSTGQRFDEGCFPIIWKATEGQPWLVNALGYEVTVKMKENRDRSTTIIPEMIDRAKERIIHRRETHIDILIDKLKEDRVRRVLEPILSGEDEADGNLIPSDDIQYVADLGLIKIEKPRRISNGIYKEIIPRELTWSTQTGLTQQPQWYENSDTSIKMEKLLLDFQQFFRENADSWIGRFDYAEAGPQLLLQCFLQRIVNGGGYIDREYGLGRKRTDLLVRKPLTSSYGGPVLKIVLELKILRKSMKTTINEGLRQTFEYMDSCGSVDEGHLIIFDRSKTKSWDERIWHRSYEYNGRSIIVWAM